MKLPNDRSLNLLIGVFLVFIVLDGIISYSAIKLSIAYELNPLYYRFGDFFWAIKGVSSLFVVGVALKMYENHPFLTVRTMTICSGIMALVVIWNLVQVTMF